MKVIAYIPQHSPHLEGVTRECHLAEIWDGAVLACDAVTVHPGMSNTDAIEAAYRAAGVDVWDWDLATPESVREIIPTPTAIQDGIWQGEDVVIVGGGPSLAGFDFARLRDWPCKVIAVNRACEVTAPDLVFGMDCQFFEWEMSGHFGGEARETYLRLKCPIVAATAWPVGDSRAIRIARVDSPALTDSLADGLQTAGNSGFGALHLALLMGARRVYLLGFDCTPTHNGKTNHFHSGYGDTQPDSVYNQFAAAFNDYADELNARAEIVNCNPDSGIRCFPFGGLPDGAVNPGRLPRCVTYITPDYRPVFEEHLKPGIERFNLRHTLMEKKSRHGWKANTAQKPDAIIEARRVDRRGGVVWLDADSSVERPPVLFRELERQGVDFACYTLPSGELLSSVLYFGRGKTASALLRDWAKRCAAAPDKYATGDQKHLQDAVEAAGITPYRLPASYCKIFDHTADEQAAVSTPAIVQWQASRKMKARIA